VDWRGGLRGGALGVLREVTVVGDGAIRTRNLAGEHFGQRAEILDYYHACEHLWAVAKALFDAADRARAWAEARCGELDERGGGPVRRALRDAKPPGPAAAAELRPARGCFRTNAARTDYPRFRAPGLPIGSGAVESAAKHLVQRRMKRAGMRWSEPGGDALLAPLAHRAAGRPLPASAFTAPSPPRRLTPTAATAPGPRAGRAVRDTPDRAA
jgi:hypothetical protein